MNDTSARRLTWYVALGKGVGGGQAKTSRQILSHLHNQRDVSAIHGKGDTDITCSAAMTMSADIMFSSCWFIGPACLQGRDRAKEPLCMTESKMVFHHAMSPATIAASKR
jgi:hypothetical protein